MAADADPNVPGAAAPATAAEPAEEVVLTSRRAWLNTADGTAPGRMRLTDRWLEVRPYDGSVAPVRLDLMQIRHARAVRRARPLVEVAAPGLLLRFRCFSPAAVAALIESAAHLR